MKIQDEFRHQVPFTQGGGTVVLRDGSMFSLKGKVQNEHVVSVLVDGEPILELVCSPDHLAELVVGRLCSSGMVEPSDIRLVHISKDGFRAHVFLREGASSNVGLALGATACVGTCNSQSDVCGVATLQPVEPMEWKTEWVFLLADALQKDTPMHKATFGAHSCMLLVDGEIVCCREDLGRHNAFDKVIGFALINGVNLARSVVFASGRLPVDMVTKAIRAHVPVLASKAVPTNLTIDLAREYNLTLVCSAHSDSLVVFNDPLSCAAREGDGVSAADFEGCRAARA